MGIPFGNVERIIKDVNIKVKLRTNELEQPRWIQRSIDSNINSLCVLQGITIPRNWFGSFQIESKREIASTAASDVLAAYGIKAAICVGYLIHFTSFIYTQHLSLIQNMTT